MSIHPLKFEGAWLTEQGEAHVVLAQVAPPSLDILTEDASRPWVIETIRGLLGADRHLAEIVTGNRPAILVLPELALGFGDWETVDALVRDWPRPLIVISGFGVTRGDRLNAWLIANGPTARHAGWPNGSGPADTRLYNGGWCWIHRPGATACVSFLKATAEQHDEIHIEGLDQGTFNLLVRVNDLIIFPVICSDLLSTAGGHRVVPHKIARYLEENVNDGTRVLVVGLLLQKTAHEKWRNAVIEAANSINSERVNVCLVNSANNICAMYEDADRWRDYSGVYVAKERHAYPDQFAAVRRFSTEQIDGAVVRATSAAVLGGPLRWTFDAATGRHLWAVQMDYGVTPQGALIESSCGDRFRFEALRILKRLMDANDAPDVFKTAVARVSYGQVQTQLSTAAPPVAEVICQKTLFGESGQEANTQLSADTLSSFIQQTAVGLKALGALKSLDGVAWQPDPKQKGQLHVQERDSNVLVWCYPGTPIRLNQTLRRWRSELAPARPLIVFKKATGAYYTAPHATSKRRDDVGDAPASARRGADEALGVAKILERNLDDIETCFEIDAAADFAVAVRAQLTDALNTLLDEGAMHVV